MTGERPTQSASLTREVSRRLRGRSHGIAVRLHRRWHDLTGDVEFIHINKTAGSSVEQALGLPFAHCTAQMRIERLGRAEWDRRFSFTFVRNPWDKMVSQYHFRKGRGTLREDVAFSEWIRRTLQEQDQDLMFRPEMFVDQLSWICDRDGAVAVEEVLRYERLHSDFELLARRLGVDVSLPHRKPSNHRHYSHYYDEDSINIVGEAFARDLDHFGYTFERHG